HKPGGGDMTAKAIGCSVLLVLASALSPLAVMAQQATGTIGGTVQDGSRAVLPGVTVTLSAPGVIGGNQTVTTDERGNYQFVRLVPGTYSVRGELPGFRAVLQENVVVNADRTSRVDMTMEVGGVE